MSIFDYNPSSIAPYPYWRWNKVLPAVYDDSLSQYEILSKLLCTVNQIIESTNTTGEQVEQLTMLVQQLIDGGFPSGLVSYVEQIAQAAIEDDVAAINAVISQMQGTIDSMSESIQGQIDAINTRISTYQGGDIVVIGDSYDQGYSPDFSDGVGWSTRLANTFSGSNINVYHNAIGGAGLANGSKPFTTLLNELAAGLSDDEKNKVSTIVFYGGYNDRGASSGSIASGLSTFLASCRSNFPNANRIIGAFVGRCVTGITTGVHVNATYAECVDAFNKWLVASWNAPVNIAIVNGLSVLGCNQAFSSDYVHPSKYGYNVISNFMSGVVFGAPYASTYNQIDTTNIVAGSDFTTNGNITVNNEAYLPITIQQRAVAIDVTINFSTPRSVTFNPSSMFTFDLAPCAALMGCYTRGSAVAIIKYDGKYYDATATWKIDNGKLYFKILKTNTTNTNYLSVSLQQIQLISL